MDVHDFLNQFDDEPDPLPTNTESVECCVCLRRVPAGFASRVTSDGDPAWVHYVRCPGEKTRLQQVTE